MFTSSRRRPSLDIWPGFVDALATLLMVVIFVLMTFVVSQLYLTDALEGRDEALIGLRQDLEKEQEKHRKLQNMLSALQKALLSSDEEKAKVTIQNQTLREQVETLLDKLAQLNLAFSDLDQGSKTKDNLIKNLTITLSEKIEILQKINDELTSLKIAYSELESDHKKNSLHAQLGLFRSEFFSKLQQAIGDRSDIRVVGDRFVFQSEVLFSQGSSELEKEGKRKLDHLATALKDIANKIPPDIKWILRVDGHTDHVPIHTPQFPSNWELSTARAISVVRYLREQGINPRNLVAAGFGEHQPLKEEQNEQSLARNRRIEFKIDQR